jgi:hypothetical protein
MVPLPSLQVTSRVWALVPTHAGTQKHTEVGVIIGSPIRVRLQVRALLA